MALLYCFFSTCVCSLSRHGRVVIMSIHQPRYSILKLFDTITLLSRGEMIYQGASRAALPYFSSVLGRYMHKYTMTTLYICIVFLFYAYACSGHLYNTVKPVALLKSILMLCSHV